MVANACLELTQSPPCHGGLSRGQILDRIGAHNPGATPDYLDRFSTDALALYLEHLSHCHGPRCKDAWRRPGDTRAILTREPRD